VRLSKDGVGTSHGLKECKRDNMKQISKFMEYRPNMESSQSLFSFTTL